MILVARSKTRALYWLFLKRDDIMAAQRKPIVATQLDERGQLTIPAKLRRKLGLETDTEVLLIQVGQALMLVPRDKMLEQLSARMRQILQEAGVSVEEVLARLPETRKKLFKELYGDIE
jgi:AbrB family looped-hinge helix DNA binding protein